MSTDNKGLKASFKSMDTEETLDIYFNRPIGYVWALFFQRLNVHPNVVTILSIFLGVAAGMNALCKSLGIRDVEVIQVTVSKLSPKNTFDTQPAPWIISCRAGE